LLANEKKYTPATLFLDLSLKLKEDQRLRVILKQQEKHLKEKDLKQHLLKMGRLLETEGKIETASIYFSIAGKLQGFPLGISQNLLFLRRQSEQKKFKLALLSLAKQNPGHYTFAALLILGKHLSLKPISYEGKLCQGFGLINQGKLKLARRSLTRAENMQQKNKIKSLASLFYLQAKLKLVEDENKEALALVEKALLASPGILLPEIILLKAKIYLEMNAPEKAYIEIRNSLLQAPSLLSARWLEIEALKKLGKTEQAKIAQGAIEKLEKR
jgi:hypothetical protein